VIGEFRGNVVGVLLTINITCRNMWWLMQKPATSVRNANSLGYT